MKKTILTTAIVSAFLIGCNETKNKEVKTETVEATETAHEQHREEMTEHATDNAWMTEIELDSGSKWDANLETTEGVDKMLELVRISDAKTVEDYHNLASELNETKNFVVKKCTMKGPSHDNLHVFLHPLIEKISALGKITTAEQGAQITASIKDNLKGYYEYFQ
ncbi:hypothetical protein [Aequorivita marina]|uniref:hypothetical protein n=1 Tax=Aequorivita marina TaxID=3073654 RepID=UPI0028753833|nr:hypothetical protein [Aequorivita sp. S2608]MDS1298674.1 hypothetical protein [Aequorivita sp. S2608]